MKDNKVHIVQQKQTACYEDYPVKPQTTKAVYYSLITETNLKLISKAFMWKMKALTLKTLSICRYSQ